MRITDLLKSESIALSQKPADKTSAIRQLADLMAASGNLSDKEQYLQGRLRPRSFGHDGPRRRHRNAARQEHGRQKPASPP